MARRFERTVENPERRIETEGNFTQIDPMSLDNPYDDEFDKKLDGTQTPSKKEEFMQSIHVEPRTDTPMLLAYKELEKARQSGIREDIIKAEDRILDLERAEEEKAYNARIAELNQMRKGFREANDKEGLKRFSQMRNAFVNEMRYDELSYKIRKLQNSQRLNPSKETLQQIMGLRKELDELGLESQQK